VILSRLGIQLLGAKLSGHKAHQSIGSRLLVSDVVLKLYCYAVEEWIAIKRRNNVWHWDFHKRDVYICYILMHKWSNESPKLGYTNSKARSISCNIIFDILLAKQLCMCMHTYHWSGRKITQFTGQWMNFNPWNWKLINANSDYFLK